MGAVYLVIFCCVWPDAKLKETPLLPRPPVSLAGGSRITFIYFAGISDSDLPREFGYKRFNGDTYSLPLIAQMQHVINHATLHRGQVVGIIRQFGITPPSTDLLFYLMETHKP